ncbi:GNAT family N-acetyltransferase [Naumannella sp. ID2617S]|nr:GNAT family N-acetyltransferase [Naumannella sp. ID2617S]
MVPRAATGVRILDDSHLDAAWALLSRDPVGHVFVAARVAAYGLDSWRLGCGIQGYFRDGELTALCHAGSNLVPVEADAEALAAFVAASSGIRRCSSIVGPAAQALTLWELLSHRWGRAWSDTREVRRSQPMMAIAGDPAVPEDPRVQRIGPQHTEAYFDAAVRMYTEEVGVSPIIGNDRGPYLSYVRRLIEHGRAFGVVEQGRVVYKSDIGSAARGVGQVQGVWLDPALRGRGLAVPAMAAVVRLARQEFPTVSLYVNSFNAPARATYTRVGFDQVGEFATVLY